MPGRHSFQGQLARDAWTDANRKVSRPATPPGGSSSPPVQEIVLRRPMPFRVEAAAEAPELDGPVPYWVRRFAKAWAALAAGVAVVLGAGIVTGSAAVMVATGVSAVTAALGVLVSPANAPARDEDQ